MRCGVQDQCRSLVRPRRRPFEDLAPAQCPTLVSRAMQVAERPLKLPVVDHRNHIRARCPRVVDREVRAATLECLEEAVVDTVRHNEE